MTGNIIAKDHGDRYHVTDTTAAQQQPEDLGLAKELNSNNRHN